MKLRIQEGLPVVKVTLVNGARAIDVDQVLVDTGSASSVFSADTLIRGNP